MALGAHFEEERERFRAVGRLPLQELRVWDAVVVAVLRFQVELGIYAESLSVGFMSFIPSWRVQTLTAV